MIATEIGVRIQFKHDKDPGEVLENRKVVAITRCVLENEAGEDIGAGTAFCVEGDQFVKEVGRRIALTRALASSPLNKEDRRIVWTTYFDR